jgi:UDP:flavonoid glycosyltransferase YjiC (YdhE family)
MRIAVIALGSRGDVEPYVALASGLHHAGHAVRVLTSRDFEPMVTSRGLEFVNVAGSMEGVARGMEGLIESGNLRKIMAEMGRVAGQMAHEAARSGLASCEGSDLIVGGLGALSTGISLSEKLGIPFAPAFVYPFTPTREFPSVLTPLPQTVFTSWASRLTHRAAQTVMWRTNRAADDAARRDILGLPRGSFFGPFSALEKSGRPVLYGYSPEVIPRPKDWTPSMRVTGYWLQKPDPAWEPPSELLKFLDSGPAPVFVGFGSMPNSKPEETADLVVRALDRTGQRGVLHAGWGGLTKADIPDSVFMIASTPYEWLFPRMSAVVHHGGAGTTSYGLWSGVPSIVTPFFGDQPFWAGRVFDLGVGPKPVPRKSLSVDTLAAAIESATTDADMRERAANLGERIRAEDGVAAAVAAIEESARLG